MPRMKGAELITEYLIRSRIPYVFGICGHGNVGMLDALYDARDRIKLVSPRHEQVAGHMADAYFRVRHEPVATLTSCGPGSANIVMPLAVALSDSSAFSRFDCLIHHFCPSYCPRSSDSTLCLLARKDPVSHSSAE